MIIISKDEFLLNKDIYLKRIEEGAVFIYPTDTIYGIGCIATNDSSVIKIRNLKKRPEQPFSIIAPSKEWIFKNCEVKSDDEKWIKKLPGPYTLILKAKRTIEISRYVNPNKDTIGVRIPKHWISSVVKELEKPIVTTSANIHNEEYMTSLDDLSERLKQGTDILIYEGVISGKPSTIVDLTGSEERIINRGK